MLVRDAMSPVILTIGPAHTLRQAARLMSARRGGGGGGRAGGRGGGGGQNNLAKDREKWVVAEYADHHT
ncbi:histidine kinase, partial [Streptomyces sp. NPDC057242]